MLENEWHAEKVDRHLIAARVFPFGVSFLDDALVGILPNDLIVIGARTGRGKTEFATTVAFNGASKGKRVLFFALEADKWEVQRRMKYRAISRLYEQNYKGGFSKLDWPRYSEWLVQGFTTEWDALEKEAERQLKVDAADLEIVYTGERYTVEQFIEQFESLSQDKDLIIIDHLHYFDFGGREFEELPKAIHAIRDKALFASKPVILIAHLRKGDRNGTDGLPTLDDFHGHSDIVKVATNVLIMSPAPDDQAGNLGIFPTYFHIAKSRRASENLPWVGVMSFDRGSNTYAQQYLVAKSKGKEQPELARADQIPKWFKRARRTY